MWKPDLVLRLCLHVYMAVQKCSFRSCCHHTSTVYILTHVCVHACYLNKYLHMCGIFFIKHAVTTEHGWSSMQISTNALTASFRV